MATTITTRFTAAQALFGALNNAVIAWREDARLKRAYSRTHNELSALSSTDLADIGLNRSMIDAVAYEATYGTPRR